jgi:hypothetical protein
MRTQRILLSLALIGLGLSASSASAHHTRGASRHQHAPRVVQPWQADDRQNGPQRPALQSYGSYCPPPRPVPRNRDADNDGYVDQGEYCD